FSSILHQRERLSFSRLPFRMKQPYLQGEPESSRVPIAIAGPGRWMSQSERSRGLLITGVEG
ncbi:hypothetical protein NG799_28060, partial [Laspinema sp. D1]|nr:hypothetical protein [Laspinema sp. D2a]